VREGHRSASPTGAMMLYALLVPLAIMVVYEWVRMATSGDWSEVAKVVLGTWTLVMLTVYAEISRRMSD
jgi:hypothetical protein